MSSPGQDLFDLVSTSLWDLLERTRAQAAGVLAGLAPEPGLGGTVLDGRLLGPLRPDAIASNDPAVATLVAALNGLVPDPAAAGVAARLHGYDPGGGQPRGLALAIVTPPPSVTVVGALTGAGPTGLAFELAAVGVGPFGPVQLDLIKGWSVTVSGDVGGGGRLQLPRGGASQVLDGNAPVRITWSLQRADANQPVVLGLPTGPHVSLPSVAVSAATGLDSAGTPTISYGFSLAGADLTLVPDFLAALIGNSLSMPLDLQLSADLEGGLSFRGGGVRVTLPANVNLPGVVLRAVEIGVAAAGGGLEITFGLAFTTNLAGLPLAFTVDGLGAVFPIALGAGRLGVDPGAVRPAQPGGMGVDLTLPVLAGGGLLMTTGPGGYGGVLDLDLILVTVQAFGLLQLPVGGQPLSFVAILSVQFPFPGIELGFGFALTAVGGVVAINRRLDLLALQGAVLDGSADQLLFPVDPASHGPAIVATLGRVFPPGNGHVIVGPMLRISWGGNIISLTVAVILDLPDPLQLVIIGRLMLALPDPAIPLVLIQATLVGAFQFSPTASTSLLASLAGSNIAGMPLHGDLFFLLRGGDDPAFVLSVGGFHPRYLPPAGVPAGMSRVQLDVTPPGFPGLRSDAYFAVTSNSIQFGAHLELCDEIAGCGVDGWFNFDALFIWDPVFAFSVHCSAGVAVQVLGETLMGVSFDLIVAGPAPWHIHGSGSVDLFLFSASLDFDVHWGSAPPSLAPPPDLGPVLTAALAKPSAWVGAPAADDRSMVTLSAEAARLIGAGHSVHPLGHVTVRQRAVPFDIEISRYQNAPIPPQTWTIASAQPALGNRTQDEFPPGEFLTLVEDQKLTRPGFERFTSGAELSAGGVVSSDMRSVNTDFEVQLIPDITIGGLFEHYVSLASEAWLAVDDLHAHTALWSPPSVTPIVVLGAQPVAVASTTTLAAQPLATAVEGFTATLQAAHAQFGAVGPAASVQIVEQWELVA